MTDSVIINRGRVLEIAGTRITVYDIVDYVDVANAVSNDVSILLNTGDGTFHNAVNYGADRNPIALALGDFNGDGAPDLAVANTFSNDVSVLFNQP